MTRWGRGWEVGVRKEIWEHERTLRTATRLLALECGRNDGKGHALGERTDLCPMCQSEAERKRKQRKGQP